METMYQSPGRWCWHFLPGWKAKAAGTDPAAGKVSRPTGRYFGSSAVPAGGTPSFLAGSGGLGGSGAVRIG